MKTENYIKLTRHDFANGCDWVVDLIVYTTGAAPLMEQYNTRCGVQAAPVVNDRDMIAEGYQLISEELATKITEPKNWQSLCSGMVIGSTKTLAWLASHGINPVIDDKNSNQPCPTETYRKGKLPEDLETVF